MNIWDILILAAIAAAVVTAILTLKKKESRNGCSCGCAGCTMNCSSRQDKNKKTNG